LYAIIGLLSNKGGEEVKVLVVGKGGREHTLVWKIAQSPQVKKVYCAPGNAGISGQAECVNIKDGDIRQLVDFAKREAIELTVVGPEVPLVEGIVDEFRKEGLPIFGPSKGAAQLEGSKVFAKELMAKYEVPTADFEVFSEAEDALSYIKSKGAPLVVKADGLAAGKGVIVAQREEEAVKAVKLIMEEKAFGEAGGRVIIEDCLEGEEVSILAFTDGKDFNLMPSSQDHKAIYDGDKGPNTGGMGAYSPAPVASEDVLQKVKKEVIQRVIEGMEKEGHPYQGVLYAGLMIKDNQLKVLEFNVRFGDPEIQAILPRMEGDIIEPLMATVEGRVKEVDCCWSQDACVCVVVASGGYPGKYEKEKLITGLEKIKNLNQLVVFHAGTKKTGGNEIVTDGGRVLGVTGLGRDIKQAIDTAYQGVSQIHFENMYYRKDIGRRALRRS